MIWPFEKYERFLEELESIFADMDAAYEKVAAQYGFHCSGCEDNCCLTRFYHHTWLEYLYLQHGFSELAPEKQDLLKIQAETVIMEMASAERENQLIRVMCPLNENGLCILYKFRPMICRLHGIAHELHPPGRKAVYSPGCDAFTKQTAGKDYICFDRTRFYSEMASLESGLKQHIGIRNKIRMTVAEMIKDFS
ncbi:MAG: hypothetical protein AB7S75_20980 [Desulfococcaceae bacterium]